MLRRVPDGSSSARYQSTRVMLESRIAQEDMIALNPPFERPDWLWQVLGFNFVPNAFVMDATGAVARRWTPADEVNWIDVVAVRFETPWGAPVHFEDFDDDEDWP